MNPFGFSTLGVSTGPSDVGILDHSDPRSGYLRPWYAKKRLEQVGNLAKAVGGEIITFGSASRDMVSRFDGDSQGLAAAILSQKGFPYRQGIQIGLVTTADAPHGIGDDQESTLLAGKLAQVATPGQIVITEQGFGLVEQILHKKLKDKREIQIRLPRGKLEQLGLEGFKLYDIGAEFQSKYLQPMAEALEDCDSPIVGLGKSSKLLSQAADESGPYRGLMENVLTFEPSGSGPISIPSSKDPPFVGPPFFGPPSGGPSSGGTPSGGTPPGGPPKQPSPDDPVPEPETTAKPAARFLRARFPQKIAKGVSFRFTVQVVKKGKGGTPLNPFKIPRKGIDIELTLFGTGFTYDPPQTKKCHVPIDKDSDPVPFDVTLTSDEPGPLEVEAYYDGNFLGRIEIEVQVVSQGKGGDMEETESKIGGGRKLSEKSVTLNIKWISETRYEIQFVDRTKRGGTADPEPIQLSRDRQKIVDELVYEINRLVRGATNHTEARAKGRLENLGIALWEEMIPRSIQETLLSLQGQIEELLILSSGDPMPWEVLRPPPREGKVIGALTELFQVTRMLKDYRQDASEFRPKKAFFIVPKGSPSPTSAQGEVDEIQKLLKSNGVDCMQVDDFDTLEDVLRQRDFDLMHFACHNQFDSHGKFLDKTSIKINGNDFVPTDLNNKGRFERQPFVFINACTSAGNTPKITAMSGWATAFRKAGAGGFIGTLWEVRDESSSKFAQKWYESLAKKNIADSLKAARQEVADTDPTRLAFTAYVDPFARFVFP